MLKSHDLKRMLTTVRREIRDNGLRGFCLAMQQRALFERQLFPFRKVESVSLDGCTFDVRRLPNFSIKLALLTKTYEDFERRAVLQYVPRELPVIELGGCIGVVACITNKLLCDPSAHVVVEVNPHVLPHLNENRTRNHCEFEVLNAAIAYDRESVAFVPSMDFWGNSLEQKNGGEPVTVKTVTLKDIISQRNFTSFTFICDIEGYEYDLVRHEAEALESADTIILETHARLIGEPKTTELLDTLHKLGFTTVLQDSAVYVLRRSADVS